MSVEIVDRRELKRRMEEILSKDSSYISLDGVNPNHIRLAGHERYIYVKNISPAQLSNDNPNIVRVQLPIRNTFDTIKNSDVSFILLGYDAQNDVCAVWNPHEVKQRLNVGKSVSFYSRLAIQQQARQENIQIRKHLNNQGEVLVFPREDLLDILLKIDALFTDETPYVAMGSRLRTSANAAFRLLCNKANLEAFAEYLRIIGLEPAEVDNATGIIQRLITSGIFTSKRRLFLSRDSIDGYSDIIAQFIQETEEYSHQYIWERNYGQSVCHYIDFLATVEEEQWPVGKSIPDEPAGIYDDYPAGGEEEEQEIEEEDAQEEVIDWETPFEDKNGVLTKIANPELIEQLKPVLTGEFKSTNSAIAIFQDFYGDRYKMLGFKGIVELLKAIDWKHPYTEISELSTGPKRKTKNVTLRVTYPDGRIIQHRKAALTYIEVIENSFPDLINEINILHAGVNIVSKELDPRYKGSQKPIKGGWYVMTNSSSAQKKEDLERISDDMELDLKVELVPLVKVDKSQHKTSHRYQKIRVTFPDGRVIQPNKVSDTLVEVVKFAGSEAVYDLNITVAEMNMILPEPHPKYPGQCKQLPDGLYVNTGGDTVWRYQHIIQISDRLRLGLKVELI